MSELELFREIIMKKALILFKEYKAIPKNDKTLFDRSQVLGKVKAYTEMWDLLLSNTEFKQNILNEIK